MSVDNVAFLQPNEHVFTLPKMPQRLLSGSEYELFIMAIRWLWRRWFTYRSGGRAGRDDCSTGPSGCGKPRC